MKLIKTPNLRTVLRDTFGGASQYLELASRYSISTRRTFDTSKYDRLLDEWVPFSESPKLILDIGCGEGTATNFLTKKFPDARVIGVDESEEMIKLAQKDYTKAEFVVGTMENIPLDIKADFVFSRLAIHYSKDLHRTMSEIARVTKKDGLFFIKDTHPFYATFLKKSLAYKKKEDVSFKTQCDDTIEVVHPTFTFEEYINTFTATGWALISMHEQYGKGVLDQATAPYKIPTSVFFVLKKL